MTPSQLDHLRAIDAHLERLLEIAKKRTSGRWEVKHFGNYEEYEVHPPVRCGEPAESNGLTLGDATYIAACSNNAEAGWESTRKAITLLSHISQSPFLAETEVGQEAQDNTDKAIESILAQWPLELLATAKV